ncbi:helix-turn-helix domain-containing protein [Ruminococcus bromii]|uniref:helix-turn-helix domain-containing protein n=1 Tax=Ruminococcus bromii TaxID=40518 RepID=UPI00292CE638|nr:helix-turn-helix domain-containing protein [Ruminococcus bromii]MDE8725818.1 helix-turn-helix domain-containing protein [Ruminococcus bromii]
MTDSNSIIRKRQEIVSNLTQARLEKGLSQAQLAEMVGTQRSNICRIENGGQNLSLDLLIKITDALGKDVSVLLEEKSVEMSNVYNLKLYDDILVTFSLEEKGLEGLVVEVLSYDESKTHLLPINMELTPKGIIKWLSNRVIPKNRAFVDEILKTFGLSVNDTKGIIDICLGLSLNDSYWVTPIEFEGKFADYNLFENPFSEALSLVAYTGVGSAEKAFSTSPEFTTNGMLRKAWRHIENDGIYLYKGGTEGAANAGNEPYSEFYACQVAKAMGLNCVEYDLENWKGILASKCRLFTDIDTSFVPISRLIKDRTLKNALDYYGELGKEFYDELCSMLVFDAVIYNEDRHFGNFGVLRDNHTGKIIKPAPVFDNGLSLFNFAMADDLENLSEYAKTRTPPYGVSFDEVCKAVMGSKQKSQLRKLLNFTFTKHPSINLPEDRLAAIEAQISKRARELMSIPNKKSISIV